MVKYDENGLVFYGTFKESVGLVGNGTPSFILTNLKKADDGVTYCCYVNTKLAPSGSHGNNYEKCTLLEIVGKATEAVLTYVPFNALVVSKPCQIVGEITNTKNRNV